MKSSRTSILNLTLLWLLMCSSAPAQNQPADSSTVGDIRILQPGQAWENRTDLTYYVIPRFRLARLKADADLSDSLQVILDRQAEINDDIAARLNEADGRADFWKHMAWGGGAIAAIEFLIIILRR